MINTTNLKRFLTIGAAVAGSVLIGGSLTTAHGQGRDPFAKPGWSISRDARSGGRGVKKTTPSIPAQAMAPSIESRIEFFKRLRETAAVNNQPLPKVTSVLTLNEMAVTGIFKTPRGYAAMVEAVPIKLSYTIYPGEKFFDGQLVAIEENRLVFRKVTKTGANKFVASVENMTLRKYSAQEEIQGTAPTESTGRPPETIATYPSHSTGTGRGVGSGSETAEAPVTAAAASPATPVVSGPIVSPLDEMDKQVPAADTKQKSAKSTGKKPVKVAKNQK